MEDELNCILGYALVRLENLKNNCKRGMLGHRIFWITICSEWINWIDLIILLNQFEISIWVYNDENNIEHCSIKWRENNIKKTMYKYLWVIQLLL